MTRGNSIRASKSSLRRKRSSRGSVSSNHQTEQRPTPQPLIIATDADMDDVSIRGGDCLSIGGCLSGAITPISRHPSISEADESAFTEELRAKANGLFVARSEDIELHLPTMVVPEGPANCMDDVNTCGEVKSDIQSCCQSLDLNFVDEEVGDAHGLPLVIAAEESDVSSEEMSALLGNDYNEESVSIGRDVDQEMNSDGTTNLIASGGKRGLTNKTKVMNSTKENGAHSHVNHFVID